MLLGNEIIAIIFSIVIAAIFFLLAQNPIFALLLLIFIFFNAILLLLALSIEFLSLSLLIIYVGAIAILFLFVIMMFNLKNLQKTVDATKKAQHF